MDGPFLATGEGEQDVDPPLAEFAHQVDFKADCLREGIVDRMRKVHQQIDVAAKARVIRSGTERQHFRLRTVGDAGVDAGRFSRVVA